MKRVVQIADLILDCGTQHRAALNEEHVTSLAESLAELPPPLAFEDGKGVLRLIDGFHRVEAYRRQGRVRIEVEVRKGELEDAILRSAGANAEHNALPRSTADKKRAIVALISRDNWKDRSDKWIADACKVSGHLVKKVRVENESVAPELRKTADGRTIDTSRIGRKGTLRTPSQKAYFFTVTEDGIRMSMAEGGYHGDSLEKLSRLPAAARPELVPAAGAALLLKSSDGRIGLVEHSPHDGRAYLSVLTLPPEDEAEDGTVAGLAYAVPHAQIASAYQQILSFDVDGVEVETIPGRRVFPFNPALMTHPDVYYERMEAA